MRRRAAGCLIGIATVIVSVASCNGESGSGPSGGDASPTEEGGPRDATTDGASPGDDAALSDAPLDRTSTGDDATLPPGDDASHGGGPGPGPEGGEGGAPFVCPSVCPAGTKFCNYQCVPLNDPAFGCAAAGCEACPAGAAVTALSCSAAGACSVTCAPGYADCDGNAANGCEADLGAPATCGSCGQACAAGQVCDSGKCSATCTFPKTDCGGACRDLTSDGAACGKCGQACLSDTATTRTCQNGMCVGACASGYTQMAGCSICYGQPSCCVDPTSVHSCGASCVDCTRPMAGSGAPIPYGTWPACISGQCGSTCAQGFASCGGMCVDEDNDASNCGACGHGCGGGLCVAGQCTTAAAIQIVAIAAQDIAVDGSNLYVADKSNNVWQFDKSTFAKTPIASNQATPWHIAVDSGFVYWTSKLGGAVLRAPIGGGAFQVLYSANTPTGVAVDATNVYWSDAAGIHAGPKAGQGTVKDLSALVTDPITQDATRIYGFVTLQAPPYTGSSVFSVDKSSGAPIVYGQVPAGGGPAFAGVTVDDVDVYYLSANYHASPPISVLGRQPKVGGREDDDPLYWGNAPVSQYMLAEHCLVYWSTPTVIYKQVPGGSPAHAVTTAARTATAIALDDKYLYWADASFVGRVPK